MGSAVGEHSVEREYRRICRLLDEKLVNGTLAKARPSMGKHYGALSAPEFERILELTDRIDDRVERYRTELFLTCLTGVAKDLGRVVADSSERNWAAVVDAQIAAKWMEGWPWCGSGTYRRRLDWAISNQYIAPIRRYRKSADPRYSRATTFRLEVDSRSTPAIAPAVLEVAREVHRLGRTTVHPRQVEHAVWVSCDGEVLANRYGSVCERYIQQLVKVHVELTGSTSYVVERPAA